MKRVLVLMSLVLVLFVAACSGPDSATVTPVVTTVPPMVENMSDGSENSTDDSPMAEMSETSGEHAMTDEPAMVDPETPAESPMAPAPAWQTLPLTDARTGQTFTLGDFAGQTVFVEPMATWCSNCRQQLMSVQQARAGLDDQAVVFIALSVETNISDADLARYADGLGFDWTFAVMTPELLQELAGAFGRTVANPPSTPHFVIRPDGSVSDLTTGIKSPEDIAALVGG